MNHVTFSSYDLDKFQTCPKLWDLSKRWEKIETEWPASMIMGSAVSVGLAALRQKKPKKEAEALARAELENRYVQNDEWTIDGAFKHILTGMRLGMSTNLGIKTIISADQKKYGRCRPDVIGRTANGKAELRIVDDKFKLKLDKRYLSETLSVFKHSNQLYEYAVEVGDFYGEPVTSVGINLIIATPVQHAEFYPIMLDPKVVEAWRESAKRDFEDMQAIKEGKRPASMHFSSCTTRINKPGSTEKALCEFYSMCHDLAGDEGKATAFYNQRTWR